jgi:hypothetical protein
MRALLKCAMLSIVLAAVFAWSLGLSSVAAQEYGTVPGAIPDPSTYQGSMQLQQQEQQQEQQQLQQQQQQRQQFGQPESAAGPASAPGVSPKVRAWAERPPLAPAKNPLLGRWRLVGTDAQYGNNVGQLAALLGADVTNMAQSLVQGTLQYGCVNMFGNGVVEFRPDALVGIGDDRKISVRYRLDYRAYGKQVAMLPRNPSLVALLVFDFNGDRATAQGFGCVLQRVSFSRASASPPPSAGAMGRSSLTLRVGYSAPSGGFTPAVAMPVFIQKRSAEESLADAGFKTAQSTAFAAWVGICGVRVDLCTKGLQAMMANPVAGGRSDASGQIVFPDLPAGHYYVFSIGSVGGQRLIWDVPLDLRVNTNLLVIDQRNAIKPPQ